MSNSAEKPIVWMDGEYLDWQEAKVPLMTHTLHYGTGVFEGVRAYDTTNGTAAFRLHDHTDRLFNSMHTLKMSPSYSKEEMIEIQKNVLRKNNLKAGYLRPICFYGEGRGLRASELKTHMAVAAWSWGAYLGDKGLDQGVRVITASLRRLSPCTSMIKAKINGNYINSALALQEALSQGCDEALLLDSQGYVAEGSGENFFMLKKGILFTPPTSAILPGLTRDVILHLAKDNGIEVREEFFTRDAVYNADEAFFTGTAVEITPIRELDGRAIGEGRPGPLTLEFKRLYAEVVHGHHSKYHHWLSYL